MNAILLSIATMLWNSMHIYIPFFPAPIVQMPIVTYYGPQEYNKVDTSRLSYAVWMWCEGLEKDFYTQKDGPIQWAPDVEQQLDALAKQILAKPVGKRVLFEWHCLDSSLSYGQAYDALLGNYQDGIKNQAGEYVFAPEDWQHRVHPYMGPWFEAGTRRSYDKWKFLMDGLKRHGLTSLDHVATENEQGFSYWNFGGDPKWIAAIEGDPRFSEFATTIGFTDIATFDHDHILRMNAELGRRVNAAYADGPYKAIHETFPRASISDYNHFEVTEPYHSYEANGWELWMYTNGHQRNVSQCSDMSGLHCGGLCAINGNQTTGAFPNTTWDGFLLSINMARGMALSRPDLEFWPLIGRYGYLYSYPYYSDYVAHLALMTKGFGGGIVLWNPQDDTQKYMSDDEYSLILNPISAFDKYAGFLDRATLETGLIDWQAKQIKTCAMANKKKVCFTTQQNGPSFWEIDGVKQ